MKVKNPFKKKGVVDTVVNVGIGGAANVAIDYLLSQITLPEWMTSTVTNAAKVAIGAFGGTMTTNKYIRPALDGIAVVGASNLVSSLIDGATETPAGEGTQGLPFGTIGRARRLGNRAYKRHIAGVGAPAATFMGK